MSRCWLPLQEQNKSIFLDLKLHDIPRTVGNAVKTAADHGVNLMTVHAVGGRAMLEEAAEAAASCACPPKVGGGNDIDEFESG